MTDVRSNRIRRLRTRFAARHAADDRGMALIAVILLATVMSMIVVVIIVDSTTELRRATVQVDKTSALQAAQAGIDDYQAKIAEDNLYYFHYVHTAEPVRTGSAPDPLDPGATYLWTGGSTGVTTWTYEPTRRWVALESSGFEYSLTIRPPSKDDTALTIVSTARKVNDTNLANWRAIETRGRASSVADFQTVVNGSVKFDPDTITTGSIYASGHLYHYGTAYGDLLSEVAVTGVPILPAKAYDPSTVPDIRSQISSPIDFTTFTTAISTIQEVASSTPEPGDPPLGIVLDDPTVASWKLVFKKVDGSPRGQIEISKCDKVEENKATGPNCSSTTTQAVPDIGTIYTGQDVAVSGVVQGRVTIASNNDIYVGGDITYAAPGKDILGLIARGDIVVPQFANQDGSLTWYAATVSLTGVVRQGNTAGGHEEANFHGSMAATEQGGYITPSYGGTHTYEYDSTLVYLQPPFFPVIFFNYKLLLFREVTPTLTPLPTA